MYNACTFIFTLRCKGIWINENLHLRSGWKDSVIFFFFKEVNSPEICKFSILPFKIPMDILGTVTDWF